jgi:phosphatidylglycerophosphatase A
MSEISNNSQSEFSVIKPSAKLIFTQPIHFFAFGFGSGLAPKAPGTFGTLAAVPLFYGLSFLALPYYIAACIFACIVGIYLCGRSAEKLNTHDHPGIVWDEFAGFFITMLGFSVTWQNLLIGFILFRLFDIIKPWPIKWIDKKVAGGFGIMLDDVIAGVFAWASLHLINVYLLNSAGSALLSVSFNG